MTIPPKDPTKTTCWHCNEFAVLNKAYEYTKGTMSYHRSCAGQYDILRNEVVEKCCDLSFWGQQINANFDKRFTESYKSLIKPLEKRYSLLIHN